MPKKTKPVTKKTPGLIDLKPEEVGVLSLVADYAKVSAVKPDLEKVLRESTPRAQKIGRLILTRSGAPHRGRYTLMAKRFLDASANNMKHARILKASVPQGLWVERGV
jgi:hypothetical protein